MRIISLISIFLSLVGSAQNSMLYKISGNGLDQNSYLFGTIHVQDESVFHWNNEVYNAIDACETAAFELDFDIQELAESFDTTMFQNILLYLADDLVPAMMESYTPSELADRVVDYLIPFYQEIMKTRVDGEKRLLFVDQYLQHYAKSNGKTIWGIETVTEQLQAIVGTDLSSVTSAFIHMLDTANLSILNSYAEQQRELVDAYSSMDMDRICTFISAKGDVSDPWSNGLYKRLLEQRNDVMLERLIDRISSESVFIAVGAGHLCGQNGLVELFEAQGYTMTPVDITTPSAPSEMTWSSYQGDGFTVDVPVGVDSIDYADFAFGFDPESMQAMTLFAPQGIARFSAIELEVAEEMDEDEWEEVKWIDEGVENAEDIDDPAEEIYYDEEAMEAPPENGPGKFSEILGSMDPMAHVTPEMQSYFLSLVVQIQMKAPDLQERIKPTLSLMTQPKVDSVAIEIDGEEQVVYRSFGPFVNTATCEVYRDGRYIELTLTGDPAVIRSDEFLRFFSSFRWE